MTNVDSNGCINKSKYSQFLKKYWTNNDLKEVLMPLEVGGGGGGGRNTHLCLVWSIHGYDGDVPHSSEFTTVVNVFVLQTEEIPNEPPVWGWVEAVREEHFFYIRGEIWPRRTRRIKEKIPLRCESPSRSKRVSQKNGINVLKLKSKINHIWPPPLTWTLPEGPRWSGGSLPWPTWAQWVWGSRSRWSGEWSPPRCQSSNSTATEGETCGLLNKEVYQVAFLSSQYKLCLLCKLTSANYDLYSQTLQYFFTISKGFI